MAKKHTTILGYLTMTEYHDRNTFLVWLQQRKELEFALWNSQNVAIDGGYSSKLYIKYVLCLYSAFQPLQIMLAYSSLKF